MLAVASEECVLQVRLDEFSSALDDIFVLIAFRRPDWRKLSMNSMHGACESVYSEVCCLLGESSQKHQQSRFQGREHRQTALRQQ